jgi:hypothetical protein
LGFLEYIIFFKNFGDVETVSYEPMPKTFLRLERNSKLNYERFKVIEKAIMVKSCKNIPITISKD